MQFNATISFKAFCQTPKLLRCNALAAQSLPAVRRFITGSLDGSVMMSMFAVLSICLHDN